MKYIRKKFGHTIQYTNIIQSNPKQIPYPNQPAYLLLATLPDKNIDFFLFKPVMSCSIDTLLYQVYSVHFSELLPS